MLVYFYSKSSAREGTALFYYLSIKYLIFQIRL
nr:MAG TPA: hypothetical protein [Crassvirales sp.]